MPGANNAGLPRGWLRELRQWDRGDTKQVSILEAVFARSSILSCCRSGELRSESLAVGDGDALFRKGRFQHSLGSTAMTDVSSRREVLKQGAVGALGLAVPAAVGRASAVTRAACETPEDLAHSPRIRDYIRKAREAVLAELQPSAKQLEHGLDLFRNSVVCDVMAAPGVNGKGYLYSEPMEERARAMLKEGVGPNEIERQMQEWRPYELASDEEMQKDYEALWTAKGVTLGVCSESRWSVDVISRLNYACDMIEAMEKVVSGDRLEQIKAEGKHGFIWYAHDRPIIDESRDVVENLDLLYAVGVRWSQLTHGRRNEFCGGQSGKDRDVGLTDLGRAAVKRMNQLGIISDCSHCSPRSMLDMAKVSEDTITFSHGGCRTVDQGYAAYRNITDEAMKAVAATGGIVGMSSLPRFTGDYTVERFLQHVDYAVKKVGASHVALNTDYYISKGAVPPAIVEATKPKRWARHKMSKQSKEYWALATGPTSLSPCNWPYLTSVALVCRGYSDDDIRHMIGGNVVRVMKSILSKHPSGRTMTSG